MLTEETRAAYRHVRAYVRSLDLRPDPMFSIRGQLVKRDLIAGAAEDARRRSDFWLVHEVIEATYVPESSDLTAYGREVLAAEGAAEVFVPSDLARDVIRNNGWDVPALRMAFVDGGVSWEMAVRRLPTLAAEDEVHLWATIVDDGRVYWRRSSREAHSRWLTREIVVPEVLAWQECVRSDPRVQVRRTYGLCHEPLRLGSGRALHMPDPSDARELPPEAQDQVTIRVHVWPVPPRPVGYGPRREVMVATLDV